MKLFFKTLWHLAALIGLVSLAAGVWFWTRGVSARRTPGPVETSVARMARHAMIPDRDRTRPIPEPATRETLRAGLEHWADHCAPCHANDGSGATDMGQGLYPRAPDMRLPATQTLTDGELFYIIENGVKLTGMPAWGTGIADGERASWHLVQFIRKLPNLSEEDLAEMADLNPRGPDEWRALEEERRFLAGEPSRSPTPPQPKHEHEPLKPR